ncbi:uncharacterized protein RCC_08586 [Ramularia collo-cygni]|uniref:Coenzyme Q-binding protein COQ10 START domain-containing protein n=1 Tax=Ramularia collo-cygni TaxID=112498 RepID=A0A2D3V7K5_9PEZI|nr:uncharacterized protein RCC_08586 [Ramularia collo-cygni]CZT22880.1 uncharacterized protein RCC_08586 [Ramularia collo-cygni]
MVHPEVLPTPSISAANAIWTSHGQAIIQVPATEAYSALRDFQSYSVWNKFTPSISTPSGTNNIELNDRISISYRADTRENTTSIPCRVTAVSDNDMTFALRAWLPFVPEWLLVPEKVHKITSRGEDECLYQVYETQSGVLAYAVKYWMGAKQSNMNQSIADALKMHCEKTKRRTH